MASKITKKYIVREALLPQGEGKYLQRWYLYHNYLPMEAANQFLNRKSGKSSGTGKTYAHALATWFNFLDLRNIGYQEATRPDVDAYVDYLAYGMHSNNTVLMLEAEITYRTLCGSITAIQGFYRWFEGHVEVFAPPQSATNTKTKSRVKAKKSFLYGQIYEVPIDEIIDLDKVRLRPSGFKKHWLSQDEKNLILNGFLTPRDKAIFMLLCEGMRIDEVLSIKFSAYNDDELTLKPSRSKGYSKGYEEKLRTIAFHDPRTAKQLNQYIQTDRTDVEAELGDYLEPLFVNIKKHSKSYGKAVSYRNYWGVLKDAVRRAGIDPKEIATHVGRRSFVQEKLEEREDPEIIRQMLGWASLSPLDSYRNLQSKTVIKNAAEARRKDWSKHLSEN